MYDMVKGVGGKHDIELDSKNLQKSLMGPSGWRGRKTIQRQVSITARNIYNVYMRKYYRYHR